MRAHFLLLTLAICYELPVACQNEVEHTAIESVAMNYMQAWYEGDDQLMTSVVHPQMAKKIVFDTGNGQGAMAYLSADDLLAQTKRKRPQEIVSSELRANITILDVYNNSAMVKAETQNWIDYLHMAKISGQWKIVNILWELKYEDL